MIGLLVVGHCRLAEELLAVAELIVGKIPNCTAICIGPEERVEEIGRKLEEAINNLDDGSGVLILTDLFGGTPTNVSLSFLQEKKVEVISGVNLPMLLKLSTARTDKSLNELARIGKEAGRENISIASEIMKKRV